MTLYAIIAEQLESSGVEYKEEDLGKLDVIEYMLLEGANALLPLQELKVNDLKCRFLEKYDENRSRFNFGIDGEKRPTIGTDERRNLYKIFCNHYRVGGAHAPTSHSTGRTDRVSGSSC